MCDGMSHIHEGRIRACSRSILEDWQFDIHFEADGDSCTMRAFELLERLAWDKLVEPDGQSAALIAAQTSPPAARRRRASASPPPPLTPVEEFAARMQAARRSRSAAAAEPTGRNAFSTGVHVTPANIASKAEPG